MQYDGLPRRFPRRKNLFIICASSIVPLGLYCSFGLLSAAAVVSVCVLSYFLFTRQAHCQEGMEKNDIYNKRMEDFAAAIDLEQGGLNSPSRRSREWPSQRFGDDFELHFLGSTQSVGEQNGKKFV